MKVTSWTGQSSGWKLVGRFRNNKHAKNVHRSKAIAKRRAKKKAARKARK